MSKIALTPDASGTGTFTIAAPNSNTNRTLTLPDATGTVNVSGLANEVPAGSAAAPAIYSTGDTNTGIFFPAADTIAFTKGGVEAMRIDSAGTVFFCGSSTLGVFDGIGVNVASTGTTAINVTSGSVLDLNQSQNDTAARSMIRFYRQETQNGSITTSSTATAYVTSSDYRLKENVQPMTGALGVVAQLKPVTYTWKTDGSNGQGFIAHELQAVVPDCVIGEKDGLDADGKPEYQGVDTSFLVATLTAAIQEQQAQIEYLKAEVATLKGASA